MGPDSHVVTYVINKGDMLNMILTAPEVGKDNADANSAAAGIQKCEVAELRRKFQDWDPRFQQMLELAQECSKWSLLHSGHNERWVHPQGKLLLIGDSAHAMLPYLYVLHVSLCYFCTHETTPLKCVSSAQGAAQAFEDAAFLGGLLVNLSELSEISAALSTFHEHRLSRTMEIRQRSKEMREVFGFAEGTAQERRDQQIINDPVEGQNPIMLANAWFRGWWCGYDATKQADNVRVKR